MGTTITTGMGLGFRVSISESPKQSMSQAGKVVPRALFLEDSLRGLSAEIRASILSEPEI